MNKLNNRGMGLVAVLFAVLIVGLLYYFMTQNQKETSHEQNYFQQSGIDASNYKNTIQSTNKILLDAVKTRAIAE